MTEKQRDKLHRVINAYLDGRLDEAQTAEFHRLLERNPEARAEMELQARIDESLKRLFTPPDAKSLDLDRPNVVENRPANRWLRLRAVAIVAAMLLLVVGGWGLWAMLNPTVPEFKPRFPKLTLTQAYQNAADNNFREDWACEDEKEFACTFDYRLGKGMALAQAPASVEVLGLSYANTITQKSILLHAKVNGRGIIVFVDRASADKGQNVDPASGLKLYKRKLDRLMLYEVSPLDKPYVLELLKEMNTPEEWKKDFRPRALDGGG